jgi:hypothetical protein
MVQTRLRTNARAEFRQLKINCYLAEILEFGLLHKLITKDMVHGLFLGYFRSIVPEYSTVLELDPRIHLAELGAINVRTIVDLLKMFDTFSRYPDHKGLTPLVNPLDIYEYLIMEINNIIMEINNM